jgi:D-serine deaminase-like pyridoxal phosphate-dependent protein
VAVKNGVRLEVMVDLDIGQHRTGATIGEAEALYGKIAALPGLVPAGIHAYDGHLSDPDPALRESEAASCLEQVQTLARRLEARGLAVPFKVMGGSFTFPIYARAEGVIASPGTWIYWDQSNLTRLPEMPFRPAALVMAQVIDMMPERGQVTLDLGSKAISTDMVRQERCCILGAPRARLLLHNEEHAVIATEGHDLKLGDYVLAVPGHVCTTVFLYQGSWFIDASGNVTSWNEHTARDRRPMPD